MVSALYTAENPLRALLVMEPQAARWVRELLFTAHEIDVVEETTSGERCLDLVANNKADVLLLGLQLVDMTAAALLGRLERALPAIIIVQENMPPALAREAMQRGAADVLITPSSEQLVSTILALAANWTPDAPRPEPGFTVDTVVGGTVSHYPTTGRVVCVYSPKGGVGNSHLAAALALTLQRDLHVQTGLLDIAFSYGVQPSLLGLPEAEHVNIGHLIAGAEPQDLLLRHASGLYVVAGPTAPHEVDMLPREKIDALMVYLCTRCEMVLVDCGPTVGYNVAAVFDHAEQVVLTLCPELPAIKNVASFLRLAQERLSCSAEKFFLVLNKADARTEKEIAFARAEQRMGRRVNIRIPLLAEGGAALLEEPALPELRELARVALRGANAPDNRP